MDFLGEVAEVPIYGGFLKWWYPQKTQNDHF